MDEAFMETELSFLSEAEAELRSRFTKETADRRRLPSDAAAAVGSARVGQLTLPDKMRPKMPFTKDKYLVREDPHLVDWEREVRKFLRRLSPDHGHRVSAIMIFEWATGLLVADLQDAEPEGTQHHPGRRGSWKADLRKLNRVMEWYFGKPYMTWIAGRKVPRAYKVKPGFYIKRHRPMTLTLYAEYTEGVLNP